ncbi:PAS domain-containing protein [Thermodesulfobacteriota bacterium]
MARKPTYEELEQKVTLLEKEIARLKTVQEAVCRSESRLKEAEQLAKVGHWELDLATNTLHWSDEIYRIFDLDPQEFGATYEAFLEMVHPEDRNFVDNAYTESVKNRTGYNIVHRLLLRGGTIKYVCEKCQTEYDKDGNPTRSIGTVQDITDQKKRRVQLCRDHRARCQDAGVVRNHSRHHRCQYPRTHTGRKRHRKGTGRQGNPQRKPARR